MSACDSSNSTRTRAHLPLTFVTGGIIVAVLLVASIAERPMSGAATMDLTDTRHDGMTSLSWPVP